MTDRLNKTSICSVIFLDIIDYSKKPVSEQIDDKNLFNNLINEAIQSVAQNDRIILDTGDGAAITLMGSPEEALFIALTIRDGILDHNEINDRNLRVRIGINLGSVRVVNDINNRPNIIGDGINVAQRIMSFAGENQILVSRSYFEVTSRLTHEITDMFTYSGIKQDKHIREHEVYSIKAKSEAESNAMPEAQLGANANKADEAVMLKDILKPSNLIIALVASVLLILMGWYIFILKPVLNEASPADMRFTVPPKAMPDAPLPDNLKYKPQTKETTESAPLLADESTVNKSGKKSVREKESTRQTQPKQYQTKRAESKSAQTNTAASTENADKSAAAKFKELFPPVAKPTCTQAQIAMNQCQQN